MKFIPVTFQGELALDDDLTPVTNPGKTNPCYR